MGKGEKGNKNCRDAKILFLFAANGFILLLFSELSRNNRQEICFFLFLFVSFCFFLFPNVSRFVSIQITINQENNTKETKSICFSTS